MFQVMGSLWARWTEFVWSSTLMKTNRKYTACDSPECVRCHRYQQVREEAWGKLQRYADRHKPVGGWEGLESLVLAIGEGKRYRDVRARLGHDRTSLMPMPLQNPNVLFIPTLRQNPWWETVGDGPGEPSLRQVQKALEAHYEVILKEFHMVYKEFTNLYRQEGGVDVTQKKNNSWMINTTESGTWCVFHLWNQGQKMMDNCKLCRETVGIIESLPAAMRGSLFGNASFSVLYPRTHITEHYGPTNVRIRCHMGLEVPEGCTLKVAGEERAWQEKCTLLFDDSFLHSATNKHPTEYRSVLLVDLWHPDLSSHCRDALVQVF